MSGKSEEFFEEMARQSLIQSWEAHRQAFGPILEPAFRDDIPTRIRLILALNHISRRETSRGFEVLSSIKDCCKNDADEAAWSFFWGLCCEFAGKAEEACEYYERAGEIGHKFYMPYLRLAKAEHAKAHFDKARKHYEKGVDALLTNEGSDETVLGSAYTNLTSCLTMMHCYEEAEENWAKAQLYPQQSGAAATGAILYAAMGDGENVKKLLNQLAQQFPAWYAPTLSMIQEISDGTHPHFSSRPMEMNSVESFWIWFAKYEQMLMFGDSFIVKALKQQISSLIPNIGREPELELCWDGVQGHIAFSDFYGRGLHFALAEMIKACPEELLGRWQFSVVH